MFMKTNLRNKGYYQPNTGVSTFKLQPKILTHKKAFKALIAFRKAYSKLALVAKLNNI